MNEFFHRVAALGFENLVLAELDADSSRSSISRQIGDSIMMKKSTIDLRNADLFERDSSALSKCCKIGA